MGELYFFRRGRRRRFLGVVFDLFWFCSDKGINLVEEFGLGVIR